MHKGFDILRDGLESWKLPCDEGTIFLFKEYYLCLTEWNEKMNITANDTLEEVMIFHFLDSLTPILTGKIKYGAKIIDIGSGGGFPGLPIKIVRPDVEMTLVDSSKKRISFLNSLTDRLNIGKVKTIPARAEELGRNIAYRESFDVVLSRAVAQLRVLAEYCLPLAALGGYFIAHKGPGAIEETAAAKNALKVLGASGALIDKMDISFSYKEHYLLTMEKIAKTPSEYPRRPGMPKKSPL